jgi:hypothetical protein
MKKKSDLFKRQSAYINPQELRETTVTIIGVGNVGSYVADIAMKAGIANFNLCDFDRIEVHNLPNQRYNQKDVGRLKTDALLRFMFANSYQPLTIRTFKDFRKISELGRVVFMCVDTIPARRAILELLKTRIEWELFIDTRTGLFEYSIIPIQNTPEEIERYEASLNDEVSVVEAVCGMETIVNGGIGCANQAVQKALQFIKGEPRLPKEIFVNIENDVTIKMNGENENE